MQTIKYIIMEYAKFIFLILVFASDFVKSTNVEQIRSELGKLMHSYINYRVDPCVNFYKYACGNWAKHQQISEDELSFDALDILTNKVNRFFKDAVLFDNITSTLNDDVKRLLATSEVQTIKNYYSLCRDRRGEKYQPYLRTLNFPGGWPALNRTWNAQHFDWLNMTAQLKLLNAACLFNALVAPHYQNASRNSIYISPADFIFVQKDKSGRSPMIDRVLTEAFKLTFQGLGIKRRKIAGIAARLLEFETKLANIMPEDDDKDNEEMEELTLETISQLFPEIDFKTYLRIVSGKEFPESQEVLLLGRSYFTNLVKLLNETDSATLANYFLHQLLFTIEIGNEKEELCTNEIVTYFGFALGPIYTMAFKNESISKDIEMIGKRIIATFKESVEHTNWIERETRKEAASKLQNMLIIVGEPSSFNATYETIRKQVLEMDLDLENYFKAFFKLNAYTVRNTFKKLDRLNKKNDIDVNTAIVNAFYDSSKNQIFIPFNVLQLPIYDHNLPYSVKYGALGSVIGHEMTHSLDATGSEFDANGTIREWWSNTTSKEYMKRSQCLVDQYASLRPNIVDLSLEEIETDTLDENIADNGGLRYSYLAYQNWLLANPDVNETLPHVNLTNNQLFFLSFAQFYCQKISKVGVFINLITDEHSMNGKRVIGTLSNFEKFAEDFSCPVGSKMNPAKRCRVW